MSSPQIITGDAAITTSTAATTEEVEKEKTETESMEIEGPSQNAIEEGIAKTETEATTEETPKQEESLPEGAASRQENDLTSEAESTDKGEYNSEQAQEETTVDKSAGEAKSEEEKMGLSEEDDGKSKQPTEESQVEGEKQQSSQEGEKTVQENKEDDETKQSSAKHKAVEDQSRQSAAETDTPVESGEPTADAKKESVSNDDQSPKDNVPFHWLMRPASEHPKSPLIDPTNRKLRGDYLSRRYRAYHRKAFSLSPLTNDQEAGNKQTYSEIGAIPLWSGATQLERALADCCELPPTHDEEQEESEDESSTASLTKGGSLARGYEVQFTGLVAKHCHSLQSRVLALAILERSLERDKDEALEASNEEEMQIAASAEEEESAGSNSEEEADDDDWDPDEEGATRKSKRIQKRGRGRPPKRTKTKPNEDTKSLSPPKPGRPKKKKPEHPKKTSSPQKEATKEEEDEDEKDNDNDKEEEPESDRMTVFVSAGGLKILKSWLIDAMTPVLVSNAKSNPKTAAAPNKAPQPRKFKPSKYGPMLLPLLVLLKDIPFDKNLVVESKINKQIRRLSKQVDGLVDAFKKQHKGKDAGALLETYTDPGAGAGGLVVVQVQEALNKLKETWEDHAKKSAANPQDGAVIKDPFEDMKSKLRERYDALKAVEAGEAEKPQWLKNYEVAQKDRVKKRRKIPIKEKKTSTEQLALQEREAERLALKDKLKAAEEERKAHLQRLKNQISKRMSEARVHGNSSGLSSRKAKKKNSKTVKWKDGLSSDKTRKREILEQVYILEQSAESAPERSKSKKEDNQPKEDPKEEEEEEAAPLLSNDEHGLFEFDETLLL